MAKAWRVRKISAYTVYIAVSTVFLSRFFSLDFLQGTSASIYTSVSKLLTLWFLAEYIVVYHKISRAFLLVCGYHAVRLLATFLYSSENLSRVFMGAYPILGLLAMLEIGMQHRPDDTLFGVSLCLKLLCSLCALQVLFLPNLMKTGYYLLGTENQLIFSFAVSVFVEWWRKEKEQTTRSSHAFLLYFLLLTLAILRAGSGGNMLGWGVLIALFCMAKWLENFSINPSYCFAGYCAVWVAVVLIRVQDWFAWLIVQVLHKNLTLTNRTVIWDNALSAIWDRPLLGYGVQNSVNIFYTYIFRTNAPTVNAYFSAHNQTLQCVYEGGLLSLLFVLLLTIYTLHKLHDGQRTSWMQVWTACFLGILVAMIAEAPGWDALVVILELALLAQRNTGMVRPQQLRKAVAT